MNNYTQAQGENLLPLSSSKVKNDLARFNENLDFSGSQMPIPESAFGCSCGNSQRIANQNTPQSNRGSALELYRHNQILASSLGNNMSMGNYAKKDSQTMHQELKDWVNRIFGDLTLEKQSPQQQVLFKTITEILGQSPTECSLAQKHTDISELLFIWISETAQENRELQKTLSPEQFDIDTENEAAQLVYLFNTFLAAGNVPKNWSDFLALVDEQTANEKKETEAQFHQSMQSVVQEKFLSPYEKLAQTLRANEGTHNQIMESSSLSLGNAKKLKKVLQPKVSDKATPQDDLQNLNPYGKISQLLREVETSQNQILKGK